MIGKQNFIIKGLIFSTFFLFISSCEIEKSYYESMFYGKWETNNSFVYYCNDGTYIKTDKLGNSYDAGEWEIYEQDLIENPYNNSSVSYTILSASYNSWSISSNYIGKIKGKLKSSYGCAPTESFDEKGEAIFWVSTNFGYGDIEVYFDGTYEGKITSINYYSVPECGANGCVTVTADPGTYNWEATNGSMLWSSTITITAGNCSKMELVEKKAIVKKP